MRKRVPSWRKKWASDNNANVARADCGTSPAPTRRPRGSPSEPLPHAGEVNGGPRPAGSRSGQNERLTRFVANTSDHGFESVRSLWSEVLTQSEAVEQRQRVDIENLARRLS